MTRLTVRVSLVYSETNVVVGKSTIPCESTRWGARLRRRKERITKLSAEEVLFMICALPKLRIVKRDKALVDDGSLAVVAFRRKLLRGGDC